MNKPQIDQYMKEYLHDRIDSVMVMLAEIVSEMQKWDTTLPQTEIKPCIEGHKHTDSATKHGEGYPWVCESCGEQFSTYNSLVESEVNDEK